MPARLLGAATVRYVEPSRPSASTYLLGNPGRPAEGPTLLIAVFDNSGSVVTPTGTDPLSNRYAEVNRAFSVVARRGASHELGAVLHFDTPSSGEIGPVSLTMHGYRRLRSGLRVPSDGAGTSELAPSLARAEQIAGAYPDHAVTLVVLSDFLLMDLEPGPVLSRLAVFPGQVHAVVLGSCLPEGVLEERIIVTRIQRGDPPGAVARAVFASLITHRPGAAPSRADTDGTPQHPSWIPQRIFRRQERTSTRPHS